ncbi:MAG TPA: hypothetical protein VG125_14290 [Pirellulales bacterium]|nr:hypothetical protein [Pirellulales bacterium]
MTHRLETRVARLKRKQAESRGVTVLVVEDENFYGNAHLLRRKTGVGDGQTAAAGSEGTTSKPGGED